MLVLSPPTPIVTDTMLARVMVPICLVAQRKAELSPTMRSHFPQDSVVGGNGCPSDSAPCASPSSLGREKKGEIARREFPEPRDDPGLVPSGIVVL